MQPLGEAEGRGWTHGEQGELKEQLKNAKGIDEDRTIIEAAGLEMTGDELDALSGETSSRKCSIRDDASR